MIPNKQNQLTADVIPDRLRAATNAPSSNDRVGDFATDHLLSGLKGRVISSSFVSILAQGIQYLFMLPSTMILARLLSPRDFGLVAMVTTIMGFLRIFSEAGLSTATVQREGITHTQVSNLFWTNLLLGGAITLLFATLSPAIALFYREPRLIGVTLALCFTFLLASSSVQHLALLKRQMEFKKLGLIQTGAAFTGVLAGVAMALMGCGYWSLVGMQLATALAMLIMAWSFSQWRPQLPKRDGTTRPLLHFGVHLTASNFLWSLANGSDSLLIGRVYGPAPLGLYSRGSVLGMAPVGLTVTMGAVLVPTLSRLQNNPERYRQAALQIYDSVAVSAFLFTGLLLGLAHPLTLLLLGKQWEGAFPIFAGFTLVALYYPIADVASWLLASQGRGRDILIRSSIVSFLTPLFFLAGLPFGPVGVAISYSVFCLLVALPTAYYIAGRRGPVSTRDLWRRFFTHVPLWIIVCAVTLLTLTAVQSAPAWKQVMLCASAGSLAGIVFISMYPPARCAALSLLKAVKELWGRPSASL